MFESMMTQPCTIVTMSSTGAVDEGNNPAQEETSIGTACFVDWSRSRPRGSDATVNESIGSTVVPIVFPPDAEVGQAARVLIGDDEWQVEGLPARQWDPLAGRFAFVEALCTQTKVKA